MEPTKGLDKIVRSPVDNSYTLFVPEKSIGIHRAKGGNGPFAAAGHDHLRMGKERHHALEGLYAAASARGTHSHADFVAKHGMRSPTLDGGTGHEYGFLDEPLNGRSQPTSIDRRTENDAIGYE